jgi:alkylated DNA nucleotide flippase Atl1
MGGAPESDVGELTPQARFFHLLRHVPPGRVVGYRQAAWAAGLRIPAVMAGRWMRSAPPDVPWHRVVGRDGRLPTTKRDPQLAATQRGLLESEGVMWKGDQIDAATFLTDLELEELARRALS